MPKSKPSTSKGQDTLTGTDGADVITGLAGADILTGSGGPDRFVYLDLEDVGDIITDFQVGHDVIDFSTLLDNLDLGFDDVGFQASTTGTFLTLDINRNQLQDDGSYLLVQNISVEELDIPGTIVI